MLALESTREELREAEPRWSANKDNFMFSKAMKPPRHTRNLGSCQKITHRLADCTWIACSSPGTLTCPASAWGQSLLSTSAGSQISSSLGELSQNLRWARKCTYNLSKTIWIHLNPSQGSGWQWHSQPSLSAPPSSPLIILIASPPSRLQCEEEVKIKILISSGFSPQNIFTNRRTPPPQPLDNTEEQSSPLPHEVICFLMQNKCHVASLIFY